MLKHSFVSEKEDPADDTIIGATKWNDDHVFDGGTNGAILIRDTSADSGGGWVNASASGFVLVSAGTGVAPTYGQISNTHVSADAAIAYSKISVADADIAWAKVAKTGSSLADLVTRSASDLSSGTLPDGRFPATLPATSGVNLTNLNASNLASGTVPLARLSGITNTEIAAGAAIAWTKVSKTGASLADLDTRSAADLSSGTLPDARFPATLPAISGVNLTALNATNLGSGTVPLARLSGITNTELAADAAIAWTKISKTGSSLADLTTRSASDLSSGTLPDARFPATLPAASGANLTDIPETAIADGSIFPRLAAAESISGAWSLTDLRFVNSAVRIEAPNNSMVIIKSHSATGGVVNYRFGNQTPSDGSGDYSGWVMQCGNDVHALYAQAAGLGWYGVPSASIGTGHSGRFSIVTDTIERIGIAGNGAITIVNHTTFQSDMVLTSGVGLSKLQSKIIKITDGTTGDGSIRIGDIGAPAANSTTHGTFDLVKGGAGVADVLKVCMKTAGDTYEWVAIATV